MCDWCENSPYWDIPEGASLTVVPDMEIVVNFDPEDWVVVREADNA